MCCAGLVGGLALGQFLGGPWTLLGPGLGFALGLLGDMRMMNRTTKRRTMVDVNSIRSTFSEKQSMTCCGSVEESAETSDKLSPLPPQVRATKKQDNS